MLKRYVIGKKTFDIDSSESEYTSVRNGDVTFIKEQNTPTRIYSKEKMDQVKVMIAKHSVCVRN